MRRLQQHIALAALFMAFAAMLLCFTPSRRDQRGVSLRAAEAACRLYMDRYAPPR